MPFTPKQPFPKARGQTLRSEDWNDLVNEVQRLDTAKVNKAGDIMTAPLTINAALGGADRHLSILGTGSSYMILRAASGGQEILVGADGGGGIVSTMSNHDLQLRAGGNVTRMTVKSTGRVGIGTNDPSNMLHVAAALGLRVGDLYLGGGLGWSSLSYNAHHNEANNNWVFPNTNRTALTLEMDDFGNVPRFEVFSTTSANRTAFQSRFRVDGNTGNVVMGHAGGNVGIGTSTPVDRLQVATSMTVGPFRAREEVVGRLTVSGPSGELVFVRRELSSWPANPAAGDRFLWYNQGGIARLWTEVNGDLMLISSSGAVGIDTVPGVKFHVVGNRIRLQAPGTNRILDMRADGTALDLESSGAELFINNSGVRVHIRNLLQGSSSRVYKDTIAPLDAEEALNLLDNLDPVKFYYKDDAERELQLGFIAEDVPDVASSPNRTGVRFMSLIAILCRAVKEQQRQIEQLQAQIKGASA